MVSNLRDGGTGESGFTLIELLVVMIIAGILAAVAIPSFFNQRDKARDAEAKSSVRAAQTAMETYATDNNGSYSGATPAALAAIEATLSDEVGASLLAVPAATADAYTLAISSDNTPNVFRILRSSTGVTTLECDTDGNDGCPTSGLWD